MSVGWRGFWPAVAVGSAFTGVSCNHTEPIDGRAIRPAGHMVAYEDVCPECAPPANASLLYQEPPTIAITVKSKKRGDAYDIDLYAHDELFDNEKYTSTPQEFAVAHAAGEDYDPPIPVLQFPLNLGGPGWTWRGNISSEENPHPAEASVTTRADTVMVGPASYETIRSDVDLVIAPYQGSPAVERRMTFWFQQGHGVIKRDFAGTSIREPVLR